MRKSILAFTIFALVGTAPALMAQDVEREQQRREEAERQLQEAQAQLERAIQQLREAETQSAQREMEQAMAALRAAQRELRADFRFNVMARPGRGGLSVYAYGSEIPQFAVFGDDRPRIGVLVQTNRDEETDAIGAKLTAVTPSGPAEEAGLRKGDRLVEFAGVPIEDLAAFSSVLKGLNPGDEVLLVEPVYDVYHSAIALCGGVPVGVPAERDGDRLAGTDGDDSRSREPSTYPRLEEGYAAT